MIRQDYRPALARLDCMLHVDSVASHGINFEMSTMFSRSGPGINPSTIVPTYGAGKIFLPFQPPAPLPARRPEWQQASSSSGIGFCQVSPNPRSLTPENPL